MVTGNKINLSTSQFRTVREKNFLYVDKTKMIENFLLDGNDVSLVCRQRRSGKSLNLDMLRCFLTDKEQNARLFDGLYVQNSPVWDNLNSAPVFVFDFKNLIMDNYREKLYFKVKSYISAYCFEDKLPPEVKFYSDNFKVNNVEGLLYLTEAVFKSTGKKSYILIDEYDKPLTDNFDEPNYNDMYKFLTHFLSAGLKGNPYLEKGFLTGIARVTFENMGSGLNNIKVFDIFSDKVYTDDYGLTEVEVDELLKIIPFNKQELRDWYNGVMINGKPIYNIFSVMNALDSGKVSNYWQASNLLREIKKLLDDEKRNTILKIMAEGKSPVVFRPRIILEDLFIAKQDEEFYSYLIQTGYLALHKDGEISIPNIELKDAWNGFILKSVLDTSITKIDKIFAEKEPDKFAKNLENILSDKLSYWDVQENENAFHIFVFALLIGAYKENEDSIPVSNRESGDGRPDIIAEKKDAIYIFEFKYSEKRSSIKAMALKAINQIDTRRYYAGLESKPIYKIGIANHKKECKVICKIL